MNSLDLLQRDKPLLKEDLVEHANTLAEKVSNARFLVLGGAGSIGQSLVKELFKRNPMKLHVVDISENKRRCSI